MANILKFPGPSEQAQGHEFLHDDDDILRFDAADQRNDHTFSPPEEPTFLKFRPARTKDWSNQELADLFRVKRLLDAAGVPNEIDRGITDEGDPWFLFCDAEGEVFIHLCRLDGIYVLDSPNIKTPLRGHNFNALIEQFTERRLSGSGDQRDSSNQRVVRLERNGKVFLHPSTMLTALIWTLFFASDDLVMLMPEDSPKTLDLFDDHTPSHNHPDHPDHPDTVGADHVFADQDAKNINADQETASNPVEQHLREITSFSEWKLGQNSYAIGLSVIAISLGFISDMHLTDIKSTTLENMLPMLTENDGGAGHTESDLATLGLDQREAQDFLPALTKLFDTNSVSEPRENEPDGPNMDGHLVATLINQVEALLHNAANQFSAFETELAPSVHTHTRASSDLPDPDSSNDNISEVVQNALVAQPTGSAQDADQMAQILSKFGLTDTAWVQDGHVREYTFDNDTVFATFDVTASQLNTAVNLIENSPDPQSSTPDPQSSGSELTDINTEGSSGRANFQAYDNNAYEFISYLASKDGDLEVVATSNELILVDPNVFNDDAGEAFVMSWTTSTGDIISTIGLRSDYVSHDLIA